MNLLALPAFADNYIWILHDGQQALVVDPGDAAPVLDMLAARKLALAGILVTHHHHDHVGGLAALLQHVGPVPVFGPARESLPVAYTPLKNGDTVELLGLQFEVIDVPGHTAGHIAFFHRPEAPEVPLLFCGDTLFSAGCGRLFDGTPDQMHHSLSRLATLPASTRVCCAHEYTVCNLRFARAVEPHNTELLSHSAHCERLRANHKPTLPSSIGLERLINPFLRCDKPEVIAAARAHGACGDTGPQVLAALRQWKNTFPP